MGGVERSDAPYLVGSPLPLHGDDASLRFQQFFSSGEHPASKEAHFCEAELHSSEEATDPVFNTSAQVNGGRFFEVFGRATHLADGETGPKDLREHLVVKDEIIGIGAQLYAFEDFAGEGAIASVVLGKFGAEQ